jgi:hypothetical protein
MKRKANGVAEAFSAFLDELTYVDVAAEAIASGGALDPNHLVQAITQAQKATPTRNLIYPTIHQYEASGQATAPAWVAHDQQLIPKPLVFQYLLAGHMEPCRPISYAESVGSTNFWTSDVACEPRLLWQSFIKPRFVREAVSSTVDRWESFFKALKSFSAFEFDWDGMGGSPPSKTVLAKAETSLKIMSELELPALPTLDIAGDGEISFNWDTGDFAASLSFLEDGSVLAYAFREGMGQPWELEATDYPADRIGEFFELFQRKPGLQFAFFVD